MLTAKTVSAGPTKRVVEVDGETITVNLDTADDGTVSFSVEHPDFDVAIPITLDVGDKTISSSLMPFAATIDSVMQVDDGETVFVNVTNNNNAHVEGESPPPTQQGGSSFRLATGEKQKDDDDDSESGSESSESDSSDSDGDTSEEEDDDDAHDGKLRKKRIVKCVLIAVLVALLGVGVASFFVGKVQQKHNTIPVFRPDLQPLAPAGGLGTNLVNNTFVKVAGPMSQFYASMMSLEAASVADFMKQAIFMKNTKEYLEHRLVQARYEGNAETARKCELRLKNINDVDVIRKNMADDVVKDVQEIAVNKEALNTTAKELDDVNGEIAAVQKEREDLNATMEAYRKKVDAEVAGEISAEAARNKKVIDQLELQLVIRGEKINELITEKQRLEADKKGSEKTISELVRTKNEHEALFQSLITTLQTYRRQDITSDSMVDVVDSMIKTMNDEEQQIVDLKNVNQQAKTKMAGLQAEIDNLPTLQKSIQKKEGGLRKLHDDFQKQLKRFAETKDESSMKKLLITLESIQNEYNTLQEKSDETLDDLMETAKTIRDIKFDLVDKVRELEKVRRASQSVQVVIDHADVWMEEGMMKAFELAKETEPPETKKTFWRIAKWFQGSSSKQKTPAQTAGDIAKMTLSIKLQQAAGKVRKAVETYEASQRPIVTVAYQGNSNAPVVEMDSEVLVKMQSTTVVGFLQKLKEGAEVVLTSDVKPVPAGPVSTNLLLTTTHTAFVTTAPISKKPTRIFVATTGKTADQTGLPSPQYRFIDTPIAGKKLDPGTPIEVDVVAQTATEYDPISKKTASQTTTVTTTLTPIVEKSVSHTLSKVIPTPVFVAIEHEQIINNDATSGGTVAFSDTAGILDDGSIAVGQTHTENLNPSDPNVSSPILPDDLRWKGKLERFSRLKKARFDGAQKAALGALSAPENDYTTWRFFISGSTYPMSYETNQLCRMSFPEDDMDDLFRWFADKADKRSASQLPPVLQKALLFADAMGKVEKGNDAAKVDVIRKFIPPASIEDAAKRANSEVEIEEWSNAAKLIVATHGLIDAINAAAAINVNANQQRSAAPGGVAKAGNPRGVRTSQKAPAQVSINLLKK